MRNSNDPEFWDHQYRLTQTPWDLGQSTPVFVRLQQTGLLSAGRMIVLGAGSGHDADYFAAAGFDVTAVDFAPQAAAAMRARQGSGARWTVIEGDIFALPAALDGTFDIVLEYTCYCAIYPEQREAYVALVRRLLRPGGMWVALAFPIGRRPGGPPFVVQPDAVVARFERAGFTLTHREWPGDSVPERLGIEELLILRA